MTLGDLFAAVGLYGFNDNLQCIGSETKALQAVHLTAKSKLREEEQKVDLLKAEIAEHTTNRDVSLLLPCGCILHADWHYPQSACIKRNARPRPL